MKFIVESDTEQELVNQLLKNTSDLEPDEETLLRFLRAREHDIVKAEDMLRKSVTWRKDNDVISYLNYTSPPVIKDNFIFNIGPCDNEGRPVVWVPIGRWNPKPVFDKGMKEECVKFRLFLYETVREAAKSVGASQVFVVMGLEGLTYDKVANLETMHLLYSSLKELEANYPEILKTCIVINAPWIFPMAYNFFKPIFSRRTLNKLKVFDSDRTKWLPQLLEYMPMSSVPEAYRDD
jgi:hypothetical protein